MLIVSINIFRALKYFILTMVFFSGVGFMNGEGLASIKACNSTDNQVKVSLGIKENTLKESFGWWTLKGQECKVIYRGNTLRPGVSFYFTTNQFKKESNELLDGINELFCIQKKVHYIFFNSDQCSGNDAQQIIFKKVTVDSLGNALFVFVDCSSNKTIHYQPRALKKDLFYQDQMQYIETSQIETSKGKNHNPEGSEVRFDGILEAVQPNIKKYIDRFYHLDDYLPRKTFSEDFHIDQIQFKIINEHKGELLITIHRINFRNIFTPCNKTSSLRCSSRVRDKSGDKIFRYTAIITTDLTSSTPKLSIKSLKGQDSYPITDEIFLLELSDDYNEFLNKLMFEVENKLISNYWIDKHFIENQNSLELFSNGPNNLGIRLRKKLYAFNDDYCEVRRDLIGRKFNSFPE